MLHFTAFLTLYQITSLFMTLLKYIIDTLGYNLILNLSPVFKNGSSISTISDLDIHFTVTNGWKEIVFYGSFGHISMSQV